MSALQPEISCAPITPPPSLCYRGPAQLHLTLKNGQCPPMARGRVHIRAGRTLIVRVTPPHPEAKVEVNIEPVLHTQVTLTTVDGVGPVPVYHGEYAGHLPQRVLPWPVTSSMCVVVSDGLTPPCRLTIPVTVWPSFGLMATWWALVFLGVVGLRWQNTIANAKSFASVFPHLRDDLPYVGAIFLLGVPVLAALQAIGWVATMRAPGEE